MNYPATTVQRSQPIGLFVLFITEMWERFSYYGMRAILVLYLVSTVQKGGLGWSKEDASQLYGWYTGLVYLTPVLGGWLADRYIGTRRSLIIGGLIIAAGHFSLAFTSMFTFYLGMLLIIIGTGFFKPNVSTMVGQLYEEHDPRRDSGFTIFYMGINLGALIGTLICGYLGESENWGWHYGFGAAGVGMVAGLLAYTYLRPKYLPGIGEPPARSPAALATAKSTAPLTKEERGRVAAILIVSFFVMFFWIAFEQAGSSMSFFAEERTQRMLWGINIPASWFQSVNPAVILAGSPLFAMMWQGMSKRGIEPTTPTKMASGLFLLGGGFVFMMLASFASEGGVLVSPLYLIMAYVLHTFGELCMSPVGLSLVTKAAPLRYASVLMGCWFLSSFFSNILGGYIAGATERIEKGELFHLFGGLADFYFIFVVSSVAAGCFMLALIPTLKKMLHGHI